MDNWEGKGWHYSVHMRLGEVLFYYLVRIRPFDLSGTAKTIDELLAEKRLGSVRVFPIFGPYDLLIRAWLHPSVETEFRESLEQRVENCRIVIPFAVTSIDYKWYVKDVDRELLAGLNEDTVKEAQDGENKELIDRLVAGNLIIGREKERLSENIKFFIAVNMEKSALAARTDIIRGIERYIIKDEQESDIIQHPSIYRGYGFCDILVKGQASRYFEISDLPNWIGAQFSAFGISTETYLVHGPDQIAGDEKIGEATFSAIAGKNLFIQSIIPELFESTSEKKFEVETFLRDVEHREKHSKYLSQKDKKIIHDYLLGYLKNDFAQMAQTLFIYFYSLESFLRDKHKEFIQRTLRSGNQIGDLYKEVNPAKESGKFLSLGDLLRIYILTLQRAEGLRDTTSLEDWQDLAQIRNKIAHGDVDFSREWDALLEKLLKQLPNIHNLINIVEEVTGERYTGYFP
jgi:hypothetical protein